MTLRVETITNGPFQENCFLLWDDAEKTGILIDPGDEPDRIARTAAFLGVKVELICNTHGHIDHAGGVARIKELLGAPFAMHADDAFLLDSMPSQAGMFGLPPMEIPKVDRELGHGDTIRFAGHEGQVIHTPGHTPGGCCFLFGDLIFVGDTLFAGSVGRTDLPGGSARALIDSIKTRLLTLDDRVRVFCGHGPATTIGSERGHNPFLNGAMW
ncbi:MAG: MBL fold metallo-hydrolase [Deltaproteobacteria bacterium]|nr:MBL fold metallo-hydrolase [Deltaproteobacteria bacterium]